MPPHTAGASSFKRRSRRTRSVVMAVASSTTDGEADGASEGGSDSPSTSAATEKTTMMEHGDFLPPAVSALNLILSNVATDGRGGGGGIVGAGQQKNRTYVAPCASATSSSSSTTSSSESNVSSLLPPVQESLSSLLASRSLSRSGRSDVSWDSLRFGLSDARGSNGFVPRWVYPRHWNGDGGGGGGDDVEEGSSEARYYLPGTRIPSPLLFSRAAGDSPPRNGTADIARSAPPSYLPRAPTGGGGGSPSPPSPVIGSARASSPPYHATYALETFYLSNQTYADLNTLGELFEDLYEWHAFLHDGVMGECPWEFDDGGNAKVAGEGAAGGDRTASTNGVASGAAACRNVIHPFESSVPLHSPLWKIALRPIIERMTSEGWRPGFDIPREVTDAWDFPGDEVYNASLYLLECQYNASLSWEEEKASKRGRGELASDGSNGKKGDDKDSGYESYLIAQCPFALLDISHLSALTKSDTDLLQISHILHDENAKESISWEKIQNMQQRAERSRSLLASLWNETRGAFLSRTVRFHEANRTRQNGMGELDDEGGRNYEAVGYDFLDVPAAHNFLGLWDGPPTSDFHLGQEMRTRTAYQFLQSEGEYAFHCREDEYPVRLTGGCGGNDLSDDENGRRADGGAVLDPALNYLLSRSLNRSSMSGLSAWLRNSTLNFVCGLPNTDASSSASSCPADIVFAAAFGPITGRPFHSDHCDLTSTLAAASVHSSALRDPPFTYRPAPPISSSGVIVLIAIELGVAMAVGISCAVLSLGLRRRLRRAMDAGVGVSGGGENEEGGDAFVRMAARTVRDELMDDLYGPTDNGVSGGAGSAAGFMEEIDDDMFASAPPSVDGRSRSSRGGGGSSSRGQSVTSVSRSDHFLGVPVTPRLDDSFADRGEDHEDGDLLQRGNSGDPTVEGGDGESRVGKLDIGSGGGFKSFLGSGKYNGWFSRRRVDADGEAAPVAPGEPLLGR